MSAAPSAAPMAAAPIASRGQLVELPPMATVRVAGGVAGKFTRRLAACAAEGER